MRWTTLIFSPFYRARFSFWIYFSGWQTCKLRQIVDLKLNKPKVMREWQRILDSRPKSAFFIDEICGFAVTRQRRLTQNWHRMSRGHMQTCAKLLHVNELQLRLGGRLSNCCSHLSCHPWTRETLTHSHRFQWKNTPNSESKPRVFDGWVDDCRTAESIYPVTLELVKTWSSWSNLSAARFSERVFKHLPKSDFSALQSDFSTLIFGQKMVFFLYSIQCTM